MYRIFVAIFAVLAWFGEAASAETPIARPNQSELPKGSAEPTQTVATANSINHAPLTECDRLASYVHDQERLSAPVAFDQIEVNAALPACQHATATYPGSARLSALLGRVLLRSGNPEQAEIWFLKAAKQGHVTAQHSLARILLERGEQELSAFWLLASATQGFYASQGLLGDYFASGIGVARNKILAVRWWRAAAEQGDAASQLSLGDAYLKGSGVMQDQAQAMKWYLVASRSGNEIASRRVEWATRNLPRNAIINGMRGARTWREKSWSDVSHMLSSKIMPPSH